MPGGDRRGPLGRGEMTGRAAGFCAGFDAPGYVNPMPDRGRSMGGGGVGAGRGRSMGGGGAGVGRGAGRGMARGFRRGAGYGVGFQTDMAVNEPMVEENQELRSELSALRQEMSSIKQYLHDMSENKNKAIVEKGQE